MPARNTDGRVNTARRVRAARAWANMSQPELARLLEMSLSSLRRIEQEARDVTTNELLHIGEVCNVPRNFMLFGWSERGKSTQQSQADALEGIITDMTKRIERHEKLHALAQERIDMLVTGTDGEMIVEMKTAHADLMRDLDTALQQPPAEPPAKSPAKSSRKRKT